MKATYTAGPDIHVLPSALPLPDLGDLDEAEFFHGFDVLNRAIAPWTAPADEATFLRPVRELAALRPARLLSAHGPTVREEAVPRLFEAMARIPSLPARLPGADLDLEAALDAHEPTTG
ncbi:hypothetical protein ACFWVF_08140 [Streptomyces sp. NPDC058659]|uniref:hypothetical protein n=1 Tax=unclassified Streptomyces TaxID=2593676 RepID=UPI003666F9CE